MNRAALVIASLATVVVLGGCGALSNPLSVLENPRPWPDERRLLAKDWVVPQVEADEEPVFCYRTLGKVDCYGGPLSEEEQSRIMAPYEPPPYKRKN